MSCTIHSELAQALAKHRGQYETFLFVLRFQVDRRQALWPSRRTVVVEPFAGSACYSLRWNVESVKLYDVSQDICGLWDFLINCSERDITDIPDDITSSQHMLSLGYGQRRLVGFWVAKGRAEPSNVLSPWYAKYKGSSDCKVWGAAVKSLFHRRCRAAN